MRFDLLISTAVEHERLSLLAELQVLDTADVQEMVARLMNRSGTRHNLGKAPLNQRRLIASDVRHVKAVLPLSAEMCTVGLLDFCEEAHP